MKKLVLFLILPIQLFAYTIEVFIPRKASVIEGNPRIVDVVKIKAPKWAIKAVSRKRLNLSLKRGKSVYVSRSKILKPILDILDGGELIIRGEKRVLVTRRNNFITPDELENLIKSELKKKGLLKGFRWYLSLVYPRKGIEVSSCVSRVKIDGLRLKSGRQIIGVSIIGSSGRLLKKLNVSVDLTIMQRIPVASRELERGRILGSDDVVMKYVDISRIPRGVCMRKEEIVGKRLRRGMRRGEAFISSYLEDIPLVRSGSPVYIIAESGFLRVTAIGRALESGKKGDIIRVRNISSKKIVYGEVVEKGIVKVRF